MPRVTVAIGVPLRWATSRNLSTTTRNDQRFSDRESLDLHKVVGTAAQHLNSTTNSQLPLTQPSGTQVGEEQLRRGLKMLFAYGLGLATAESNTRVGLGHC